MGTRPGLPTVALCLALGAAGCQPQAASEDASSSDTPPAQTVQEASARSPVELPCPGPGNAELTAAAAGTVVVELGLDEEGELTASHEEIGEFTASRPVSVHPGQALQWRSDTLRWRVAFLGGKSPYPPMKDHVMGDPHGASMPEGERAVIGDEPGCYYYVATAVHPETGAPLLLDPPIVVRER